MKTLRFNWLYIKIGLYAVLLYSVVTVMQYVKSTSFSSNVEVLMGSPSQSRVFEWCSSTVQVLYFVESNITVRESDRIQDLCRLSYSSYKADEVRGIDWKPLMKSLSGTGQETVLESDKTLNFIKMGSLIYKVDGLKSKLSSMGLSQN